MKLGLEARVNDPLKNDHPRRLESRAELRDLLVSCGLSRAASERIATAGWSALQPKAVVADVAGSIRAATEKFKRLK